MAIANIEEVVEIIKESSTKDNAKVKLVDRFGFNENVFKYCKPEVIILSDKDIIHKTQEGQTQTYAGEVSGNGIVLNGKTEQLRKVLTTRSDGHLWIRIEDNGSRTYKSFT
jgi:hypothetical protein